MKIVLALLFLTFALPALGVGDVTKDADCVATALATTDPSNAVGEAISNAVAQAFSKVVACNGDENSANDAGASSLAISVAVAIASSETAGAECVAESDAVAEVVSDLVTQGVAGGLLENTDPAQQTLAEAWLADQTSAIATRLQEGASPSGSGSGSCSVAGLQQSLSTAQDVSAAMEDAISQILQAVACGDNIVVEDPEGIVSEGGIGPQVETDGSRPVEEEAPTCRYDSEKRKFFGPCNPAKSKRRNCNREFRDCKNQGRQTNDCHRDLKACSDDRLSDVVKKGANRGGQKKKKGLVEDVVEVGQEIVRGNKGNRGGGGGKNGKNNKNRRGRKF